MSEKHGLIRVFIEPALIDLLPAYLMRRNADVLRLQTLIEAQDFESIQRLGHNLFGNGSMFGFDQLSKTGQDLELAAKEKDLSRVRKHAREISDYLAIIEICPKGAT